jgi:UDP-3-O-[3-hydroxymyristoyl] glucosamine N-acyltransferase
MNSFSIKDGIRELEKKEINFDFKGNENIQIHYAKRIDEACDNSISFYRGDDFQEITNKSNATNLFIVKFHFKDSIIATGNYIFSDKPELCFCILASLLMPKKELQIHPSAVVSDKASIGKNVSIGAGSFIDEGVFIGDGTEIQEHCVIKNAVIGKNCVIQSGVTIGNSGLGSYQDARLEWYDFPHFGKVVIGDNVTIQDNSVISRGTLNDTIIENFVRIGPGTLIAHGVKIGNSSFLTQNVTIAGSVTIGENVRIWGGALLRDGISIGNNSVIGMGAVVTKSVPSSEVWFGNPATRKFSK